MFGNRIYIICMNMVRYDWKVVWIDNLLEVLKMLGFWRIVCLCICLYILVYIFVKLKFILINRYELYKVNIVIRSRYVKYGIFGILK